MNNKRTEKTSKDGKMKFSGKTEIDGKKVNWDFLNDIINDYDNKNNIDGLQ